MPDLSMLTSTRTNFHLKTALIYQNVGSPELLDQVTKMFDRVIYYEVDGFHFSPNWPHPTEAELASADVLFAVQLPPNLISIDQMPRLQFFQGLSSGVGHILSSPFWQSIPQDYPLAFSNATGLQVSSIGEHVVASILMLWHRLPTLIIRAHQEEAWVSNAEMGGHYIREMRGAVVGVLGTDWSRNVLRYGAIGREVARLSSAFGTTIIACTRSGTPTTLSPTAYQVPGTGDTTSQLPVAYYSTKSISSFHDFLSRCDVVVNTLPGTPDNYRLIGEAELRVMKGDALLVNGTGLTLSASATVRLILLRPLSQVYAFGLNRMDISQRQGHYPLPPGVSTILGVEFSGVVSESKSSKWKEGDEVFGLAFGGAYAEYIAVAAGMVTAKPKGVSWVHAASIPENWLTAYQALFLIAGMKPGQSVMIHAGASGVGLAAIQLANSFGASLVIATAGSDEKVKFIEQHGAKGINYKTQDFSEEVAKLTNGTGVNVVIDFVGPDYWSKNIASLARDGHMVLLGMLSGLKTKDVLDMGPLLFKRLRIEGTTLRSRSLEYQSSLLREFTEKAMQKVFSRCGGGEGESKDGLDLVIHKVYSWKQIIEAHEEMEAAKNIGKIICEIIPSQ
ncbi:NADPH:quinone reductase, partial [Phenoliferia sp. Uapishka_3]